MAIVSELQVARAAIDRAIQFLGPGVEEEVHRLLCEVYSVLWTEAYYDPYNESTEKFARPLADKMKRLNELMGFRR